MEIFAGLLHEAIGLDPASIAHGMRGRLLLDPYRLLPGPAVAALGLDYFTLGAPPLRAAH